MKDIINYEGLYKVSEDGQIWSVKKGRFIAQEVGTHGYKMVRLSKVGKKKRHLVHRLVATAFCKNKKPGYVVDHEDGNKFNNSYTNLFWKTQKENVENQKERGTFFSAKNVQHLAVKARKTPIVLLHPTGEEERFDSSSDACRAYNLNPSKIHNVLKGKQSQHKGFKAVYYNG